MNRSLSIVRRMAAVIPALAVLAVAPVGAQDAPREDPAALLHAALEAMGGEARWRDLASIRVEGVGHEHALEQSERPEGPWITTYRQFTEIRDLDDGRLRRDQEQRGFWSPEWQPIGIVADREAALFARGERRGPAQPSQHAEALEALDLSPERILLTALAAPDLARVGDTLLQKVPHETFAFTWDDRPVRLYLNAHTRLPAGYALPARLGNVFTEMWGDVPTVTVWSLWSVEPGGWLYPRQRDVFRLGHPLERESLTAVAFDVAAPADSFAISDEVRAGFAASKDQGGMLERMRPGVSFRGESEEPVELAPGVVTTPGMYATTLVEQDDGIVVLDAPMTSAWSRAVLEEASRRFPDKEVKAVVSTSDAWLHVGGVREYVARGIPVHALDLNLPLLERLLDAPRGRAPDALAGSPGAADLRAVSGPIEIGEGPNRLVVYPVHGEGGERMMVVWLPEHRVLYASDLVQIQPVGTAFWPEYLLEVHSVVERHDLAPETVFAMHTPPMSWSRVVELLEAAGSGSDRDGR